MSSVIDPLNDLKHINIILIVINNFRTDACILQSIINHKNIGYGQVRIRR